MKVGLFLFVLSVHSKRMANTVRRYEITITLRHLYIIGFNIDFMPLLAGERGSPLQDNNNFATFIKIVYDTKFRSLLAGVR